jgi:tetratricopeptide (TPR) repeat protein
LCFQQAKEWVNALNGFESVASGNASQLTEYAALYGARIAYFELQEIKRAAVLYEKLYQSAGIADNKTEALRGMLRCYYKLKEYESGQMAAEQLLNIKTSGNDDKALSYLINGYVYDSKKMPDQALQSFRQTVLINKGEWSAEARYQIARILFDKKDYTQSEKAAFEVVNKNGSYEVWVARSYLLIGNIYFQQKDYFNAKATFQSVADNVSIEELRNEALEKLKLVVEAEKNNSKVK